MKIELSALLLALAWSLAPLGALAIPVTAGTAELVTIRSCTVVTTGCDQISPIVQSAYGGFPGAFSSSASTSLAGYGSASGSVALSGTVGAPVLRATATAELGQRTNTNSVALQSYTYTGATTATRTFGGVLTYSQLVTGPHGPGVGDGITASIDIFSLSVSDIEVGGTSISNFNALLNLFNLPGYTSLDFDSYVDSTTTTSGLGTLSATVTLSPGDTVWVRVLLQTPAANGARIDASNTLITSWDVTADLTPGAVSSVPEPSTLALLFICALVSITTVGRAKSRPSVD